MTGPNRPVRGHDGRDLWRVLWDGGTQRAGTPFDATGGEVTFVLTADQMKWMLESTDNMLIGRALVEIMQACYEPGKPLLIHRWGAKWLQERGWKTAQARRAASLLETHGYVDPVNEQGQNNMGPKIGYVPGSAAEQVEVYRHYTPRRQGRKRPCTYESAVDTPSRQNPATRNDPVDNASHQDPATRPDVVDESSLQNFARRDESVDSPHSRVPVSPGINDTQRDAKAQVSASFQNPATLTSSEVEKKYFYAADQSTDAVRFFAQPALPAAVAAQRVAMRSCLRVAIEPYRAKAIELLTLTGHPVSSDPSGDAADLLLDMLAASPDEQVDVANDIIATLRRLGVKTRSGMTPAETIARFAVAWMASLSNPAPITSPGGWFFNLMYRAAFPNDVVKAVGLAVNNALVGATPAVATDGARRWVTARTASPDLVARLRQAAQGTSWLDSETDFENLLNNPARQRDLLGEQRRDAPGDPAF